MSKFRTVVALSLGVIVTSPLLPKPVASALTSTAVLAQGQGRPPEWTPASRHDTSAPLRQMPPRPITSTRQDYTVKLTATQPPSGPQQDQAVQQFAVSPLAAVAGTAFDGVGEGNPNFFYNVNAAPPDTVGEAGLTQYVQWVNSSFAVFDKVTGTPLYGPAGGNTLWSGFGGPCQTRNDGDPIVQYDQLADRWILTQFALQSGSYMQCVAISATSDALGAWHRYAFSYAEFPDYPKLSVWPDAYYITFNMFGPSGQSFTGGRICAYDRSRMLSGLSATQVCVQSNSYASSLVADLEGKTLPPPGTASYVLNRSSSGVLLWRFSPNFTGGTATITGPTALPVAAYTLPCSSCIPQPSTTQRLDSLGDRLMYRASYRNLGSRAALLASHSVASGGVVNIRWYEFDVTNATPTVRQQATYAPGDGAYRWMPSIAMDNLGNIAVGYSVSSSTVRPSIRFAGRDVNDPPNTLSLEDSLQTGTGSQLTSLSRWGDYSSMTIDPVDDCTFWYTSEFLKTSGTFNWSTRISSFKFVTCGGTPGFTLGVTPSSRTVTPGQSTTFAATVTSQNGYAGTGTFSVTGLPANTTASWSPSGYTGGSGSSTLTVNTTATTPAGSYSLTLTATDSTATPAQSTVVTLNVNGGTGTPGLVGHWMLDESSGTTASDSSGNGNNGTLINGPAWQPSGKVGGALSFDGVNDYVSLGNPSSLIPGNALTLAGWMNLNSLSSNRFIISKYNGPTPTFLRYQTGAGIVCSIGGTSILASTSIAAGTWYHLACTYDGAMIRLYVDGTQIQTLAKTGPIADEAGTAWLIGARSPSAPAIFMSGLLDDMRIYTRALGAAEVAQLVSPGPTDTVPPVLSNGSPSGTLPAGTTQATLAVTTNENATCRYATVAGTPYASMTATFATTGGTSHSTSVTNLSDGNAYTFYVRCQDGAGNANTADFNIAFSVATGPDITTGLVGHWKFDETSGTIASDSSGNGNNGVLLNGPVWQPSGAVGGALSFDGVNDYVSLGNPASLIPGNAMTLAGWMNLTDLSSNRFLISKYSGPAPTFLRYQRGAGIICSIGGTSVIASANILAGVWYHTACTYDGSIIRVYVNGTQIQTLAKTGPIADEVGTDWLIGARTPAAPAIFMSGLLDDMRIYTRALNAAEVSLLFTGTSPVFSPGVTPR